VTPPTAHPDFDLDEAPPWEQPPGLLDIEDLGALLARVDSAPPPLYLIRGVMAEGDHGMLAAEFKAGKTWAENDLAVSVASGTPWLGIFETTRGPVLLFAGEGGARKIARRFRAVCESRGIDPANLPIRVCLRVPHLTSEVAMAFVEEEIAEHKPRLVIIDPLYLAARGARGADLYEMGAHLERIQVVCQRHGSALLLVHHWNKTGDGKGAKRMSGAGPDAWGRVLISMAVISRHTDRETKASTTVLDLDFQGDEIAESTTRIRRRVWADDPEDLSSPLHYEVELVDPGDMYQDDGLRPSARRVHDVLSKHDDGWLTVRDIGDRLADDGSGMPLKARTIQVALETLHERGLAESLGDVGMPGRWREVRTSEPDEDGRNAF
jgi:hypothetical protein